MYLGSIPIPAPPSDVLALRSRHQDDVYLVLFFDAKRTWFVFFNYLNLLETIRKFFNNHIHIFFFFSLSSFS